MRLLLFAHVLLDILVNIKRGDFDHVVSCDRLCFRPLTTRKLNLVSFIIQLLPQAILHLGGSIECVDLIGGHNFGLALSGVRHWFLYSRLLFGAYVSTHGILDCANLDVVDVFNFDLTIIFRINVIHSIPNIRSLLNKLAVSTRLDPTSIHLLTILADLASSVLSYLGGFLASRALSRALSEGLSGALRFLDQGGFVGVLRLA